jgi:NAD(P)-dependent dehydrogenase (short-subunit alcohol dehydrogenase family)
MRHWTRSREGAEQDFMPEQAATSRTVLITGAARRIGRVIALDFATRGWNVGLHCHTSTAEAEALAQGIKHRGGCAAVLKADLADVDAVERLVPACTTALGAPTCLVNNASVFLYDTVDLLQGPQWDLQLAVNLKAPVFLAKSFSRHLPDKAAGTIINIIDQRVWKPTPHFFSYAASKAGLWAVTQTLAQALAPRIRVNAIGPGPTLANVHQTSEQFARQSAATLLERGTTPEEIAAAVRFILDAPAMTGQMIALDGGQHLAWQTPDITAAADKA